MCENTRSGAGDESAANDSQLKSRWDSLPRWRGKCNTYRIQVSTREIGLVNAIVESYGDVARIQTEDIRRGIVSVVVPEEWDDVYQKILESLSRQVRIKQL